MKAKWMLAGRSMAGSRSTMGPVVWLVLRRFRSAVQMKN